MAAGKIRWGELEEDDGGDLDFLLPPRVVIGPDENGFKKTIEYLFDDDGTYAQVSGLIILPKYYSMYVCTGFCLINYGE
jgi:hypothetical protein